MGAVGTTLLQGRTHEFVLGGQTVRLETAKVAKQAQGSVMVFCGETAVLVTVCASSRGGERRDFFPLTVNYQERAYAGRKIPGGYFKREGRPAEDETLKARLIDRSFRPLFDSGFLDTVQVVATVMSIGEKSVDCGMLSIIGASAALMLSGLPFQGPVGVAHVGRVNNEFITNPGLAEDESALDLIVSGTQGALHMVESEAQELSTDLMLDALSFAQTQINHCCQEIEAFVAKSSEGARSVWAWEAMDSWTQEHYDLLKKEVESKIAGVFSIAEKMPRYEAKALLKKELVAHYEAEDFSAQEVKNIIADLERNYVRAQLLAGGKRIDGRDNETVRPISIELGVLPSAHGSALFTRGETQVLAVVTLSGSERDAQMIDGLTGETKRSFMLHYNFPPFCVGETGMMGSPKRREIGHGRLAKRGVKAIMPAAEDFPYVIRIVAEVLESNGSSSMASICGSSLAMMQAGVPIKTGVSGIAMGLIQDGDKHVILSDILGDEDHLGDMDFKVAGSSEGITALQMDIKTVGLDLGIMRTAIDQARSGQLHILDIMNNVLAEAKTDLAQNAPRVITIKINPDKIRDVIGRGGATIRDLTERHGASIDIADDGIIKVCAQDGPQAEAVKKEIEQLTAEVEIGKVYHSKVVKVLDFGAFVSLIPGQDGFLHISQVKKERIEDLHQVLKEGDSIRVVATEFDKQGRIKVSARALLEQEEQT
jgi:polyribonucleotide nucleotidyltransferase